MYALSLWCPYDAPTFAVKINITGNGSALKYTCFHVVIRTSLNFTFCEGLGEYIPIFVCVYIQVPIFILGSGSAIQFLSLLKYRV